MIRTEKKPYIDLVGQRFGRLVVVALVKDEAGSNIPTRWMCACDCGKTTIVRGYNLRSGGTNSCGCLARERASERTKIHGEAGTRIHHIWNHMKQRCENPTNRAYRLYGGRGISVCDEWHEYTSFRDWAMDNGYQDNLTLDRIDVNGNYEPSNCRWITLREQQQNKRNNVRLTFMGETRTICDWAEVLGCFPSAVYRTVLDMEGRIIK